MLLKLSSWIYFPFITCLLNDLSDMSSKILKIEYDSWAVLADNAALFNK